MEENENALKHLFDQKLLKRMADELSKVYPAFDRKHFVGLMPKLKPLEMKPRVRFLRDELHRLLPAEYPKALEILLKSAAGKKLSGFDLWPYTEFVQTYGLDHLELSLDALSQLTQLFTAEWAVRPFIKQHEKKTMKFLEKCARDQNEHLRRWASEGSRPRLPWGERLQDFVRDPSPTLPILEILKFDESLYVRKSVSNHLNDIAKDHPELVVKILARWQKEAGEKHAEKIDWIIHRSLRTLIKNGHGGALKLIGVSTKVQIELVDFKVAQNHITLGEKVDFTFGVKSLSSKPQKLVVDYIVHFVKANQSTAPKVFKLKTFELPAKGVLHISKSHPMKKITTREYYPGMHAIEIQVNGVSLAKVDWRLKI
jgi:3-methyladenine DNA glycosylase AlkC